MVRFCGMRCARDAGTSFRVFFATSVLSLHIVRGPGIWLFVDFTYRSIPFRVSCILDMALGDFEVWGSVCTDVVFLQRMRKIV